ncbi:hypothetical protein CPC08DRAFT_619975, partial [Agrocybe pediades]
NFDMSFRCEAGCHKFFQTSASMYSHLTTARSCTWYMKGKLRDLGQMESSHSIQEEANLSEPNIIMQLTFNQVVDKLGLSYRTMKALHNKLDAMPERGGQWEQRVLKFDDNPEESFTIRFRNPIEVIKSLWKDPDLSPEMVFKPQQVYKDSSKEHRVYSEMWTGKWWNSLQVRLNQGGTIAPVIIATDKTQLTQFSGNKSAYPVYLTIGNIPKATRRKPSKHACILLGYLSVTKLNRSKMSDQAHRSKVHRLFHESMKIILSPLIEAGRTGVEMIGSNGDVRKVFPILTTYVADYPEQCLVACTKYGTCPKCKAPFTELQATQPHEPRTQAWMESIMNNARDQAKGNPRKFHDICMSHDVGGGAIRPFWEGFPLTDIHKAISPDVLHQLYQGVFKHLVGWCQAILTP